MPKHVQHKAHAHAVALPLQEEFSTKKSNMHDRYAMKLVAPQAVHINRGNHESRTMNSKYSFEDEVLKKYDK